MPMFSTADYLDKARSTRVPHPPAQMPTNHFILSAKTRSAEADSAEADPFSLHKTLSANQAFVRSAVVSCAALLAIALI